MNGVRPSMVLLAVVLAATAGLATGAWWSERGDPRWPSYAELFEQAAPSVVNVSVEGGEHRLGSGFAVADDEVLTSLHIVDNGGDIKVRDITGAEHTATLLGSDARSDLALLSVPGAALTAMPLGGTDELRVGDAVVAIGNPFGLGHSLSAGVVGQRGRRLARDADNAGPQVDFVQLSIPLNPGNSGGPVLDASGRVVGVLSGVHTQGQAIAFAVPVEVVTQALPALRAGEMLSRAYLGARFTADPDGVAVVSITPHSPADRSGMRVGDRITAFGGEPVAAVADIEAGLDRRAGGDPCEVRLLRDGALVVVDVLLADWAEQPVVAAGMTLRAAPGMGGQVLAVRPRSRAEAAGISVGDHVRAVDGVPVRAPADVKNALSDGRGSQVELLRDGVAVVVALQDPEGHSPR